MKKVVLLLIAIKFAAGTNFRLPKDVYPSHYTLKIQPNVERDIFYGEVHINLVSERNLNKIHLHSKELNITECWLNQQPAVCQQENTEMISVSYDNEVIELGSHVLAFKYQGLLKESVTGFSKDQVSDGDIISYIYVTDLEPTSARKVFPCFDEPAFKSKFNVRLVAPNETYNAISNMHQINKFKTSHGVVYDFATSVKMSTYLVSFAFCQSSYYEDILEDGDRKIPIRIHTINPNERNNGHAANCTKNAIRFYSEYTNISYPLQKLDMIEYDRTETAATENWGLITFRQGILSLDMDIFDANQIKLVMYHELGHFWFGNLVTNDWWNDLWLQEGFATYMSYKLYAKDDNMRQVEIMKSFHSGRLYEKEAYSTTNSVVSYLKTNEDIGKKFDELVYDKGAGILLMLEELVGEDIFQIIIRSYLSKYAYRTATTEDFIAIVEETFPNANLRAFLESYIYHNKFPMISVKEEADGSFILTQQVCETSTGAASNSIHLWTIPVSYITNINSEPKTVWFDRDMEQLKINEPNATWILFNPRGTGMYKTNMTLQLWEKLMHVFDKFDQDLAETVMTDVLYGYMFNLINCDVPINFMKAVSSPKRWTLFFPFYDYMSCMLIFAKKPKENEIFWKYLIKRFQETGFKRKPLLNGGCVTDGELVMDGNTEKGLNRCAAWIQEHLSNELD